MTEYFLKQNFTHKTNKELNKERDFLILEVLGVFFNFDEVAEKYDIKTKESKVFLEILFKKLGFSFLDEIRGNFLIIFKKNSEIFVVRDHFGNMPVYFSVINKEVYFCSDIETLINKGDMHRKLNEDAVVDYILCMGTKKTQTFYKDIYTLPSGSIMKISESFEIYEYYVVKKPQTLLLESDNDYAGRFKNLFLEIMREQIALCEGKSGFSLSGGLDSSSIICSAKEIIGNKKFQIKSYTVRFKNLPPSEKKKSDETEFVNEVLKKTKNEHDFIDLDSTGPISNLKEFSKYFSQPLRSPNYYVNAKIYEDLQRNNFKYHFEGFDGDDTVSHGYERLHELATSLNLIELYKQEKKLRQRRKLNFNFFTTIKKKLLKRLIPKRAKNILKKFLPKPEYVLWSEVVNPNLQKELSINDRYESIWGESPHSLIDPKKAHLYSMTNPSKQYGIEFLREVSKIYNVTVLLPFFDRRLIEFCLSLPSSQKLENGYDRYVFRNAMEGIIPDKVKNRTSKSDISYFAIKEIKNINITDLCRRIEKNKSLKNIIEIDKVKDIYYMFQKSKKNIFLTHLFQLQSLVEWVEAKNL